MGDFPQEFGPLKIGGVMPYSKNCYGFSFEVFFGVSRLLSGGRVCTLAELSDIILLTVSELAVNFWF